MRKGDVGALSCKTDKRVLCDCLLARCSGAAKLYLGKCIRNTRFEVLLRPNMEERPQYDDFNIGYARKVEGIEFTYSVSI